MIFAQETSEVAADVRVATYFTYKGLIKPMTTTVGTLPPLGPTSEVALAFVARQALVFLWTP